LSKKFLPNEFGLDYLIKWYQIRARYLISVHDELGYLVKEEDKYRAAPGREQCLHICSIHGMNDLPQGIAFCSAVEVDKGLREDVDMECGAPSQQVQFRPDSGCVRRGERKLGGGTWN
jgi:DNA polymerase gamma 1